MAAQSRIAVATMRPPFIRIFPTQSNTVTSNQTTQDRPAERSPFTHLASNSGVNLDEELTNLTTYQQAYAAGARVS